MDRQRPTALMIAKPPEDQLSAASSPSSPRTNARRRKNKMSISTKTNEELILQSQQQLLEYVDRIDQQVKKIVKSHEGEFLLAYRNHLKMVKSEMEQLKQRSLESMNQHRQYIEHIEGLEKQLKLFREESLKLSQKNVQQAQKIEKLSYEIKMLKTQMHKENAKVNQLTLKNKELKTLLYQYQSKNEQQIILKVEKKSNIVSLNKTIEMISNVSKGKTYNTNERPYTTQLNFKDKQLQIRSKSVKKDALPSQYQKCEEKLQNSGNHGEQTGPRFQQRYFERKIKSQNQRQAKDCFSLRERMLKRIRHTANYTQKQLQAMQSKHLADRNEYQVVFKNCVEEVRKEVLRRNGMLGLNYFKLNGPRDLAQFKKVDYHMLLQLFLKNQLIIQTFYQLVFAKKDDL